jgi:Flp pilus assembly protein TadD
MMYGERGYYQAALAPLSQAARLTPDSYEIQYDIGLTYFRLSDYAEARRALERSLDLAPDFFPANALLGATLFSLKDANTRAVLARAHTLDPDNSDTTDLLFSADLDTARRALASGEYARAAAVLREACALKPENPEPHRLLRDTYLKLHDTARAQREAELLARLAAQPASK